MDPREATQVPVWMRYGPLLTALSVALLATGPLDRAGYGELSAALSIPIVLATAAIAVYRTHRHGWIIVVVWAAMSTAEALVDLRVHPVLAVSLRLGDSLFVGAITVALLHGLLQARRVTLDTILGGITIYLFIAVFFLSLYAAVEMASPGSFVDRGEPLQQVSDDLGNRSYPALAYYSIVTMTTLGFGDITPVGSIARSLSAAEAVVGQLYVAIMIAFLVGTLIAQRGNEDDAGR